MNILKILQDLDADCSILHNGQEMDQLSEPGEECQYLHVAKQVSYLYGE